MADIRTLATGSSLVPQARTPARNDTVRAAQRAFFEAALAGAAQIPAAPTRPVTAAGVSNAQLPSEPPGRVLRPGSLVDIKV